MSKSAFSVVLMCIFASVCFGVGGDMGASTEPLTDGSQTYPYLIEDFDDFAVFCNDSSYWAAGVYTKLMCNIDLAPTLAGRQIYRQAPIAGDTDSDSSFDGTAFEGVFDGNNNVISNLTITKTANLYYGGLFGRQEEDSVIKNLGVENISINGSKGEGIGGLCGDCYGSFSNCHTTGSIEMDSGNYIAGMFGKVFEYSYDNNYVDTCYSSCDVTLSSRGGYVGGLSGRVGCPVMNSYSTGTIRCGSGYTVSGFSGILTDEVSNCYSTSNIIISGDVSNIGGFCSKVGGADIINCYYDGVIEADYCETGGIFCGFVSSSTITDCYVTSDSSITGGSGGMYIGGFMGKNYSYSSEVTNCQARGSVHVGENSKSIGGFCGHAIELSIKSCSASGSLNLEGGWNCYYIGGVCGYIDETSSVSDCISEVNIEIFHQSEEIGGVCGYNDSGTITGCSYSGVITLTTGGLENSDIGGVCGYNDSGTITDCSCSGVITLTRGDDIGGVCGYNNSGTITGCSCSGVITLADGDNDIGGVCGCNSEGGIINSSFSNATITSSGNINYVSCFCNYNQGEIRNCYSICNLSSYKISEAAGFCNYNQGEIRNCYSICNLSSSRIFESAGFCYRNSGEIENCYSSTTINSTSYFSTFSTSGFCHYSSGNITNCFWDNEVCDFEDEDYATGLTNSEMMTLSTYTDTSWDFVGESVNGDEDIWRMCSDGVDYPRFVWEYSRVGDYACGNGVDVNDLNAIAADWLDEGTGSLADGNFDGIVNMLDLAILVEYWLYEEEEIDPDLIAHWTLDGDVTESINGMDASSYGNLTWETNGAIDGSVELDGDGDYLTTPFVIDPGDGAFSAFAWVKGGAAGQIIIAQADTGITGEVGRIWFWVNGNGYFASSTRESGGSTLISNNITVTDGQWHHVGMTFDGNYRTLYVDGVAAAIDSSGLSGLEPCTGQMFIGSKKTGTGNFWNGLIDEVRIYQKALTLAEVQDLSNY